MSANEKRLFEILRRICIQAVNALDDILGLPRTIPTKEQRRKLKRIDVM